MASLARVGEEWDGYTILEVVGSVGLAERYRVRGADGKTCLLDVLAVAHPDLARRLRAAELASVSHPHLLEVREVVTVVRSPGVVCDDANGLDLDTWLLSQPSLHERIAVIRGIADGLAALHDAGIAHGYLQPRAIIVACKQRERTRPRGRERNQRPFALLGLPGVASVVYQILREGGSVTSSGGSLGEPGYQAPEQQRSARATDLRSDSFGLGCLAYHILTGKGPFHRLDPLATYRSASSEGFLPVALQVDVPEPVGSLVARMLSADPALRPTPAAVSEALAPFDDADTGISWWVLLALGIISATGVGVVMLFVLMWMASP